MTQEWHSALLFSSLAPPPTTTGAPAHTDVHREVQDIAMHWQGRSSQDSVFSSLNRLQQARVPGYGPLLNRIAEIHGLAGSIGEQLTLAWAAEQDAQRWRSPDIEPLPQQQELMEPLRRMAVRALCETSTHFLLGAAHSLANLVLRIALCHPKAAEPINEKVPEAAGFAPATENRDAWRTFGPRTKLWSHTLPAAAKASGQPSLTALITRLTDLQQDQRFHALDERRGTDYHRHRPQSLDHLSPRTDVWSHNKETGISTTAIPGATADSRRDEKAVHTICVNAMHCIAMTMRDLDPLCTAALDELHLTW